MSKSFKNSEVRSPRKSKLFLEQLFSELSQKNRCTQCSSLQLKTVDNTPDEKGTTPKTVSRNICIYSCVTRRGVCSCKSWDAPPPPAWKELKILEKYLLRGALYCWGEGNNVG